MHLKFSKKDLEFQFLRNKQALINIVSKFENIFDEEVEKLEKAYSEKDFEALANIIHTLKGICANFYAHQLFKMSSSLEIKSKNKNVDRKEIDDFLTEMRLLINQLQEEYK